MDSTGGSERHRWWEYLRDWVVDLLGDEPRGRVRFVGGREAAAPSAIHVLLGSAGPDSGMRYVASDRFGPEAIVRMVTLAAERSVEPRAWVLHGLEQLPVSCRRRARWVARLAGRAGSADIVIPAGECSGRLRRRLGAHLRRYGCRVRGIEPNGGGRVGGRAIHRREA
jgi:hypothetical protein